MTKPDLTLNMDEKVYLSVAKNETDKLTFVYTVACLRNNQNMYDMLATTEIHTFKDKKAANLYHDTIEQIVDFNTNDDTKQIFFQANENKIKIFMQYFNNNIR